MLAMLNVGHVTLKSMPPKDTFLCDPISPGEVSNLIFNVTESVEYFGYYWVRQHAPPPAQADVWIFVG